MIAIIDYGMGNTQSVMNAVSYLGHHALVTSKHDDIRNAEKLILPGVGAFGSAMDNLNALGLVELLTSEVIGGKKPILGICLGMQLFARHSQEAGQNCVGLSWLDASVKLIKSTNSSLRVPHIGWNDVAIVSADGLFDGISDRSSFYFVHSYKLCCSETIVTSTVDYGGVLVASIVQGNIYGTQFHPERSKSAGLSVIKNFLR